MIWLLTKCEITLILILLFFTLNKFNSVKLRPKNFIMTDFKKFKLSTILIIIIVGLCFFWFRQIGPGDVGSPEIKNKDIIEHIKFLSDDKRAGRYPGTRESKDVIAYIINQFKKYLEFKQAGGGKFIQATFSILDSVKIGKNNSLKINDRPYKYRKRLHTSLVFWKCIVYQDGYFCWLWN